MDQYLNLRWFSLSIFNFLSIESTGSIVVASRIKEIIPRLPFLTMSRPPGFVVAYTSSSSALSSGDAKIILLKLPVPLLGSKVTLNSFVLLDPTTQDDG